MPDPARPFEAGAAPAVRGEVVGEGPAVLLCHGLTATRRYVLHGSRALQRAGHTVVSYDARGHGESDPAPGDQDYGYPRLVDDLEAVVGATVGGEPFVLAGDSMGAHTAVAYALRHPERVAGLVLIGPVFRGAISSDSLEYWDGLASALEEGGADRFVTYIQREQDLDPDWQRVVLRFTRERMLLHSHPLAVAEALRQVPRSRPFDTMSELEALETPALVVASHDKADPGHPYEAARAYASRLPRARLVSETEGESPLAWQGGKLSREIADFCAEPEVAERHTASGSQRP
jgi:pimeloyl-ACP methyl ester carboxylesterase